MGNSISENHKALVVKALESLAPQIHYDEGAEEGWLKLQIVSESFAGLSLFDEQWKAHRERVLGKIERCMMLEGLQRKDPWSSPLGAEVKLQMVESERVSLRLVRGGK